MTYISQTDSKDVKRKTNKKGIGIVLATTVGLVSLFLTITTQQGNATPGVDTHWKYPCKGDQAFNCTRYDEGYVDGYNAGAYDAKNLKAMFANDPYWLNVSYLDDYKIAYNDGYGDGWDDNCQVQCN